MKIFIVGRIIGANRSQHIYDCLESHPNVNVFHQNFKSVFRRRRFNNYLYVFSFQYIIDLFRAIRSDRIIYLAMNEKYLFFLFLLKIFRKIIIVDFYTSRLFFNCDAGKIDPGLKPCSMLKKIRLYIIDKSKLLIGTKVILLQENHPKFLSESFSYPRLLHKSTVLELVCPDMSYDIKRFVDDKFNVCWWGKASKYHGIEYILDDLINKDLRIHFFDDNESRSNEINRMADKSSVSKGIISIRSDMTFSNGLGEWLAKHCDLALGTFGFLPGSDQGIANKTLESWSLRLPVCTQFSIDMMGYEDCAYFMHKKQEGALADLILKLASASSINNLYSQEVASAGNRHFIDKYSPAAFCKKLMLILDS